MSDAAAPAGLGDPPAGVPRRNGEMVFESPWEGRAFGLAAAYVEATGLGWAPFRERLIATIAEVPAGTPYYEAWVTALERLLADTGLDVSRVG